jgi:hypothetical protein
LLQTNVGAYATLAIGGTALLLVLSIVVTKVWNSAATGPPALLCLQGKLQQPGELLAPVYGGLRRA